MDILESAEFRNLEQKAHGYNWGVKKWSDWGLLFRFLIIICKLIVENTEAKNIRKKRKPSAWSVFLGEQMRAGKTPREASELWHKK